jgi:hypothetical protein
VAQAREIRMWRDETDKRIHVTVVNDNVCSEEEMHSHHSSDEGAYRKVLLWLGWYGNDPDITVVDADGVRFPREYFKINFAN